VKDCNLRIVQVVNIYWISNNTVVSWGRCTDFLGKIYFSHGDSADEHLSNAPGACPVVVCRAAFIHPIGIGAGLGRLGGKVKASSKSVFAVTQVSIKAIIDNSLCIFCPVEYLINVSVSSQFQIKQLLLSIITVFAYRMIDPETLKTQKLITCDIHKSLKTHFSYFVIVETNITMLNF
jgi:hypothetical protein